MNFKFITTFRFLKIVGDDFSDFDLMPGVGIIREREKIRRILSKEFKMNAGLIEYDHFYNANHIIYGEFKDNFFNKDDSSGLALLTWLVWLDMLIYDSWLVKDNAFLCEIAYCNKSSKHYSEWSNNSLLGLNTLSSGERYVDVEFNRDDLIKWEETSNKLQTFLNDNNSTVFKTFISKEYSRYGRAYSFIKAARRDFNPAMKIAHYCSALESLFSTDNTELTHKLSERVAVFLKDYGYDPVSVYEQIKSYYSIRSKVTHGDSLQGKKLETIPDNSKEFDKILRVIMNIIISSDELIKLFNGDSASFDLYFKKRILCG